MELVLTAEEQEFLLNLLEQRHRDLLAEIAHTDHRDFRQELRRHEKILDTLATRLRGALLGHVA